MNRCRMLCFLFGGMLVGLGLPVGSWAEVDWELANTLTLPESPVDVAHSQDGKWTFLLSSKDKVFIYSATGELEGMIPVGPDADSIDISPKGEKLFVVSSKNKVVKEIDVDFVRTIDVANSPFMGNAEAPVTMIVFSDFQ